MDDWIVAKIIFFCKNEEQHPQVVVVAIVATVAVVVLYTYILPIIIINIYILLVPSR